MAPHSLTLEDLLALVRFLLLSASTELFYSPPPAATKKLLLNLQELLSAQNLPLPEDIVSLHFYPELAAHQSQSQVSSKFLSLSLRLNFKFSPTFLWLILSNPFKMS